MGFQQLMVPSGTISNEVKSAAKQRNRTYVELCECRSLSNKWLREYEIPGRKLLFEILSRVYAQYLIIEALDDAERDDFYEWMRRLLKADGISMHFDAPKASILLRIVFKSLDKTRVSRYARALEAAHSWRKPADKFTDFVQHAGGIAKVPHAPVMVAVKGQPAKEEVPPTAKMVVPVIVDDPDPDIGEDELEEMEYSDELWSYLESKRTAPILSVPDPGLDASCPERVVLLAELVDGQLHVLEQVPFVDEAIARSFRNRFATCDELREATNSPVTVTATHLNDCDE